MRRDEEASRLTAFVTPETSGVIANVIEITLHTKNLATKKRCVACPSTPHVHTPSHLQHHNHNVGGVGPPHLVRPVHLLVVQVPQVRVETPLAGDVSRGVTADVPLSDHVCLVARRLHVLGEDLPGKK